MDKKIYYLLIIIIVFIVIFTGKSNRQAIDNNAQITQSDNSVIIQTEPMLSDDLNQRIAAFNDDSVNPVAIDNNASKCDISIYIDDNPCITSKTENIYQFSWQFEPQSLSNLFSNDKPAKTIKIAFNSSTNLTDNLTAYLKNSFTTNPPKENKLIFAGDMLLTRWVALRSDENNDPLYPFRQIADTTKNADLTIGNLEAPFAPTGPYTELGVIFRGDPKLADGLAYAGFDIVNLANNHFGDSLREGMKFTFQTLNDRYISYYGAGDNQTEARKPVIKTINGIKYAFLGYTDPAFTPVSYEADNQYAGVNLMNINTIGADIAKAKEQADFVIVTMNSGVEYTHDPNETQIDFARKAIDEGADMIFGLHPHVVQAIEYYKNKPIFYNVGNFAMDQLELDTKQGYIIQMATQFNQITSVKLLPYHIYDYCQPALVEGNEASQILSDILEASKKLLSNN